MNFLNIVLSVRLWPQSQIKMCIYIRGAFQNKGDL